MKKFVKLTDKEIENLVMEAFKECLRSSYINEDMTRGQVENEIEEYTKSREFQKRVHNIVVDAFKEFIENMWAKKSFWTTMLKKK